MSDILQVKPRSDELSDEEYALEWGIAALRDLNRDGEWATAGWAADILNAMQIRVRVAKTSELSSWLAAYAAIKKESNV